jgi:hypothetical protein
MSGVTIRKSSHPKKSRASSKSSKSRVRKTATNDEKCLQYHCKSWLDKSGIWSKLLIFHVANERKGSIGAAMHFKRMGVRPGVADWLVFPPGRSVAIEMKDDEGEQNEDQKKFERQWKAAGNMYFVARTLEEFQGIIQALIIFV